MRIARPASLPCGHDTNSAVGLNGKWICTSCPGWQDKFNDQLRADVARPIEELRRRKTDR